MTHQAKRIAILGATKGMGRALARQLCGRGDQLFLLGRDPEELSRSAQDLETRGGSKVATAACDLEKPETFEPSLRQAEQVLGGLDAVVVTAGVIGENDELETDLEATRQLLTINFTHTILFCEQARQQLLAAGGGVLCVFTSVAGDRGRKPRALYGASKAGLARYLESLDHNYREQGLVTVDIRPGFVKTGMTAGKDTPPFAGEPEAVAKRVVRAMDRGEPLVYTPFMWRWVMLVIRWLPRFVMRRIGF